MLLLLFSFVIALILFILAIWSNIIFNKNKNKKYNSFKIKVIQISVWLCCIFSALFIVSGILLYIQSLS